MKGADIAVVRCNGGCDEAGGKNKQYPSARGGFRCPYIIAFNLLVYKIKQHANKYNVLRTQQLQDAMSILLRPHKKTKGHTESNKFHAEDNVRPRRAPRRPVSPSRGKHDANKILNSSRLPWARSKAPIDNFSGRPPSLLSFWNRRCQ